MTDKNNSDTPESAGGEEIHPENAIKSKRKLARRRITLSITRICEIISKGKPAEDKRRLEKEVKQLREDFETARRYPVNSPTCKLAYANSPTSNGQLAYVGELTIRRRRVGFLT